MGTLNEEVPIPIQCPRCDTTTTRTVGQLLAQPVVPCEGCGVPMDGTELVAEFKGIEDTFKDLKRDLENL